MTEKGKAFLAEASKNEELKAKLSAIDRRDEMASIQEAIRLAKGYGFDLSEEDLTLNQTSTDGVMADDDLDVVAGGVQNVPVSEFLAACGCYNGGPGDPAPSHHDYGCELGVETQSVSTSTIPTIEKTTEVGPW